jgi:cellulose synthase/poly-beta-1,6-N-acetylglucosamine synthase-like glycosyltransferase
MAYNEEGNIGRLLYSLLRQKLSYARLHEIYVVASGCEDRTEDIVRDYMQLDERIHLLVQAERYGKASAINLFLSKASGEILVLESADTVPEEGVLEKVLNPFRDQKIGMTGARPIPVDSNNSFIGFAVHLMWFLHHKTALIKPKLGELVAFRNFIREIPSDSVVDEAFIEALVKETGYDLCYVPDAIVQNKGPENIRDFIKQRRRIASGHKYLLQERDYEVSTFSPRIILKILAKEFCWKLRDIPLVFGTIALEVVGRILGYYDYYVKKEKPFIWEIASSTKKWD